MLKMLEGADIPSKDLRLASGTWIGYTSLRTDLPGGRHANVRTMRARVVRPDGSGDRELAGFLASSSDTWTQFAGWSPDGTHAVVGVGWQDPENARWEESHRTFRMEKGRWRYDCALVDVVRGTVNIPTAVDPVGHYNSGLHFRPDGKLGFTSLVDGVSKPFLMDADGRNKRLVSGDGTGFTYGYTASPNGKWIAYHEDYQVWVARADGSGRRRIDTGNPKQVRIRVFGPTRQGRRRVGRPIHRGRVEQKDTDTKRPLVVGIGSRIRIGRQRTTQQQAHSPEDRHEHGTEPEHGSVGGLAMRTLPNRHFHGFPIGRGHIRSSQPQRLRVLSPR